MKALKPMQLSSVPAAQWDLLARAVRDGELRIVQPEERLTARALVRKKLVEVADAAQWCVRPTDAGRFLLRRFNAHNEQIAFQKEVSK